jgi:hypothetical protein
MNRTVPMWRRRAPNAALLDAVIEKAWWRRLAESERDAWLAHAGQSSPALCWDAYKNGAVLPEQVLS